MEEEIMVRRLMLTVLLGAVVIQSGIAQPRDEFSTGDNPVMPGKDRLAGLEFKVACKADQAGEALREEKELHRAIDEAVRQAYRRGLFSGTVLVARGKDIFYRHACGEASKRFHVPNNIDTKFNLGSMNKMFTATAVMRLVEEGRLSLDDTIDRYVDETWLPKDVTSRVTIHHLLSHTSGLGSYFNRRYEESSRQLFRRVDDYKPLIKDDRPAFEPGQRFRYSNTGMFLLGVVIESVTGGDYFAHIRSHIYEPAGMEHSDCYEMDYPVENLAIGYSPAPGSRWKWRNNLYQHVIKGGPAGGGFSTVKDLHRFAVALLEHKLVSRPSTELMWKDHSGSGYGYGFQVDNGPSGKVVGHGGGFAGINSNLEIHVDSGWIVAVMSNYNRGATPVARRIATLLAGLE
jgi:CubicO group peptidase (beta-lactamase class C family)